MRRMVAGSLASPLDPRHHNALCSMQGDGMSEVDAVGEIVTGGLAARAVEPGAGSVSADGHTRETVCLNCSTLLAGDYCHTCGQRGHVHRTLTAFFHDLLHGVLHFEGKTWRTLPLLAWRPGELTRAYVEGQRARFVSPLALFLFSVFLMFAVVSSLTEPIQLNDGDARAALAEERAKSEAKLTRLTAERATLVAAGRPAAEIDGRIAAAREEAGMLKSVEDRGFVRGSTARISDDIPAWLARPLQQAAANPELLLYKVQNNAYKYSWGLIPLSLPFMWLLFPFSRRFRLYDHMVFVTYSLAFMTLLVTIATLLGAAGLSVVAGLMILIPPFHMYRQLKAAYGLTRAGALWRTLLLIVFATTAIGLFISGLFALGLF